MEPRELHVVTGAFGYSGRFIGRRLLEAGHRVRTLTAHPRRPDPFGGLVEVRPLDFSDGRGLADALRGAAVLYNTYWVRFNHEGFCHSRAVENTLRLFDAAAGAGVARVVHVSITNPSEDSPLEYFRGKARLERALAGSGLSHAIVRPAVLFGRDDILINNIAWLLRRFPVFGIVGDGGYRLQPIHVDDMARLAVALGRARGDAVVEAIGPEDFTYRELVETIGTAIGRRRRLVTISAETAYRLGRAIGRLVGDVLITREEIRGLTAGLLHVDAPPAGTTRLTDWARENAATLGLRYASELARRRPGPSSGA